MSPWDGVLHPASILMNTDFPQPLFPMIAVILPFFAERFDFGIPQAEAFVVAGGEIDVFHTCCEGEIRDGVRIEMMGGELRRKLFVFFERNLVLKHDPFMAMEQ